MSGESEDKLNYYNYFTEIEEAFVRRRGAPMLISPLDWALIEQWKQMGIPLHIVLRSIDKCFDSYDERLRHGRKINTLLYCQQEVLASYREYLESQVGAAVNGVSAGDGALFTKQRLMEYLTSCREGLSAALLGANDSLKEALERALGRLGEVISVLDKAPAIDAERLEHELTAIEEDLYEQMKCAVGAEQIEICARKPRGRCGLIRRGWRRKYMSRR